MTRGGLYYVLAGLLLASLLISIGVTVWAWRNVESRSKKPFLLMMAVHCGWIVAALLGFLAPDRATKILLLKFRYVFAWGGPTTAIIFLAHLTRRDFFLTRTALTGFGLLYFGGVLTSVFNPGNLIWRGYEMVATPVPHLTPLPGPLFVPFIFLGSSLALLFVAMTLYIFWKSRGLSRRQMAIVGVTVTVSIVIIVAQAFRVLPVRGYSWQAAVGIALWSIGLVYLLKQEQFLAIQPVTRATIMENVQDALIFVDEQQRIVDYNQPTQEQFPSIVQNQGETLATAVPDLLADDADETGALAVVDSIKVRTGDQQRSFVVEAEPIVRGDNEYGHVVRLRDVTESEKYARRLEQQTEQLDQFASVVSHDLRNPITVAEGYAEVIEDQIEAPGEIEDPEMVEEIQHSLGRMETIIDDALTLAREGQAIEERSLTSLEVVVSEAWNTSKTDRASLEIEFDDVQVYTDADRLQSLFENLFRNAVDHGPEDPTIWVGLHEDGFYVEDDGPGIPEDIREDVFESGFTTGGTGLGLAIVDQIADAHGWAVRVDDGREGGAKFVVSGVDVIERGVPDDAEEPDDSLSGGHSTSTAKND